ncbi:uncharacterized protein I206_101239 [Kwoniella pini CBS 10737]|uniref:Uncharacterized protein n=1 Tax=Kwoniella pini CBS 10737 TaxID=1296096 RepID=A0A1B9IAY6_9TREE|nr:uncharacterized protein I206_00084 [Kwoniella pini CBS 10737]OCF52788.1 hypothetical protein I206_00084 [Kwoniella pini CBS 10737]
MVLLRFTAVLAFASFALGLPRQSPFYSKTPNQYGTKEIDTWALNPTGDAAVIRVKNEGYQQQELHLLAINAQYTIPSTCYGPANTDDFYTFLDDKTFLTVSPIKDDIWQLSIQHLNYTTLPPAYPPSAFEPQIIGQITSQKQIRQIVYAAKAGVLTLVTESQLILVKVIQDEGVAWSVKQYKTILENKDTIQLIDLKHEVISPNVIHTSSQRLSAITFGKNGQISWLSQKGEGFKRHLWILEGGTKWKAPLKFDHSPEQIIFSKDGSALYLLAGHNHQKSLFHLWASQPHDERPIEPTRIPSNGTIHSAIHVGITPLDHAHLIGLKSDASKGEGKELWVISHSPHEDPTYNYENIRLTYFT